MRSFELFACMSEPTSSRHIEPVEFFIEGKKHYDQANYKMAVEYFEKVLACTDYSTNKSGWSDCNDIWGNRYSCGKSPPRMHSYFYIGKIYFEMQKFRTAFEYFKDACGFSYRDHEDEHDGIGVKFFACYYSTDPEWFVYKGIAALGIGLYKTGINDLQNALFHINDILEENNWRCPMDRWVREGYKIKKINETWLLKLAVSAFNNLGLAYCRMALKTPYEDIKYNYKSYDDFKERMFKRAIASVTYAIRLNEGLSINDDWRLSDSEHDFYFPELINSFAEVKLFKNPPNPDLYCNRGAIYAEWGYLEKSIEDYNTAISIDPQNPDIFRNRALLFLQRNEPDMALQDFSKAVQLQPGNSEDYKFKALIYYDLNYQEAAEKDIQIASELEIQGLYARNNDGLQYCAEGKFQLAIEMFTIFINDNETCAQGFKNRGKAYYENEQFDNAIQDFTRALELEPSCSKSFNERGLAYLKKSLFELAVADFEWALELAPNDSNVHINLGSAYFSIGSFDNAINHYSEAIKFGSDNEKGVAYKSRALIFFEKEDYQKAILDATKAILNSYSGSNPYQIRGLSYLKLKNYQKSILDLNYAIEIDNKNPSIFYNRALAFYAIKDFELSIADFSKVIELDPYNLNAYRNRGLVYLSLDRCEEALIDFKKALEIECFDTIPSEQDVSRLNNKKFNDKFCKQDSSMCKTRLHLSCKAGNSILDEIRAPQLSTILSFDPNLFYFSLGLIEGSLSGGTEAVRELAGLAYNITMHPIETSKEIWEALNILLSHIENQQWEKISNALVPELTELFLNRDKLSHHKKGLLVGKAITKYGISFLCGVGSVKITTKLKDLYVVNRIKSTQSLKNIKSVYPPPLYFKEGIPAYKSGSWVMPLDGGGAFIGSRYFTEHALARMAPKTNDVLEILKKRLLQKAAKQGIAPGTEEFSIWLKSKQGQSFKVDPRGIPPSVVEAEIVNPGCSNIEVIMNSKGDVITVMPRVND